MKRKIKQILICIDALLLMVYIYGFKYCIENNSIFRLIEIFDDIPKNVFNKWFIISIILPIIIFAIIIVMSKLILRYCIDFSSDCINTVVELREVTNEYMPVYIGYIFVAVSVSDFRIFIIIFLILFLLLYRTQTVAFNPMFCLLGYHYYKIKTTDSHQNVEIFVASKIKNVKEYNNLQFPNLAKINEFTYIDKGEKKYE